MTILRLMLLFLKDRIYGIFREARCQALLSAYEDFSLLPLTRQMCTDWHWLLFLFRQQTDFCTEPLQAHTISPRIERTNPQSLPIIFHSEIGQK